MAKSLAEEKVSALNAGAKEIGKFSAATRNMDANDPLQEGDVIAIPAQIEALSDVIKQNGQPVMRDGNPVVVEFMLVEITSKEGVKRNARFYPNQLAKIAFPVDPETKKVTGKVKTTGTATAEFCKHATVQEAMEALAGKQIKVTKSTEYEVRTFDRTSTQTTHIYQYDLVG